MINGIINAIISIVYKLKIRGIIPPWNLYIIATAKIDCITSSSPTFIAAVNHVQPNPCFILNKKFIEKSARLIKQYILNKVKICSSISLLFPPKREANDDAVFHISTAKCMKGPIVLLETNLKIFWLPFFFLRLTGVQSKSIPRWRI